MPEPHRISLNRAWTPLDSPDASNAPEPRKLLKLQRFFHKPTNLCPQTQVRLLIESQVEFLSVQLNGQELSVFSTPAEAIAKRDTAENFPEFGYDWQIANTLSSRNQLVLSWHITHPIPPESHPNFQAWLEIIAP